MAPAFDDYLSGIAPETGYPETFMDDIRGAYDSDFVGVQAKVVDLETQLAAVQAELQAEKVQNYDLMRANMATAEVAEPDPEDESEDEGDEDGADWGTNDLFKKDDE